jgi:tungstate transport system permease protein
MFGDLWRAVELVVTADAEVWQITGVTLQVSLTALAAATAVALPAAYALSTSRHGLARLATWAIHTATALPTVGVGLTLYFVLSASGPLGWMNLLYTRAAMALGQFVLAAPIVTAVVLVALRRLSPEVRETILTFGLPRWTGMRLSLAEIRPAIVSAILLAFARIFTELGAAIILGGNIRGATRTLATVIALEHDRGDSARAMGLGIILVVVALAINALAHRATPEPPA